MMRETLQAHWLLTPGSPPLAGGEVAFDRESGEILAVTAAGAPDDADEGTTFLTPGLVNAHTHLELYTPESPRSLAPGESMADWILAVIAHARSLDHGGRLEACRKSILEMVGFGTTCVNDITSDGASLEALSLVGMRGVVSPEFFYPMHGEPWVREIADRVLGLAERFRHHPMLAVGVSPHSPYNVTPMAYAAVQDALPEVALLHTHLAETREEMAWFETGRSALDTVHERVLGQRFGPVTAGGRPLDGLKPLLTDRWAGVHGVYLSPEEYKVLAEAGASLVHCPRSNLTLSGETIPDLRAALDAGLTVGLGTDSRFSAPDLDLRAEARVVRERHGFSAAEVFALATAGSAAAIKQGHRLGRLLPGYAADMVLWRHPSREITDPYEAWLSPETEVELVRINGRTVLERCFS